MKALLEVSAVPMMVTLIVDPVVVLVGSPAFYLEPPITVLQVDVQMPVLEAGDDPVRSVICERLVGLVSFKTNVSETAGQIHLSDNVRCNGA